MKSMTVFLAHGCGKRDAELTEEFGDTPVAGGTETGREAIGACSAIYLPSGWESDSVAAEQKAVADRLGIPRITYTEGGAK